LLAAIPLLIGIGVSFFVAKDSADKASQAYQQLLCAHRYIASNQSWLMSAPDGATLDLVQIGCSARQPLSLALGKRAQSLYPFRGPTNLCSAPSRG
jgi:hypothetical protein